LDNNIRREQIVFWFSKSCMSVTISSDSFSKPNVLLNTAW